MPKLDFDVITLGHGSGGTLSQQLLDSGVFTVLSNPLLDERHDGAIFNLNGRIAFSSDSYVISPIFFPGGNIGELAVNGTVNDLAMCGALPKYLSLSFIIEEGLTMIEFWDIINSIKTACDKAGVQVVTGDTKVVERGKGDKIFINTSGLGLLHPKAAIHLNRIKPGDKIILSNPIANHGMAVISVRKGLEFESEIVSDTRPLNHTVKLLLDQFGDSIHFLRDPTRGGVASVLNEVASDGKVGITIFQKDIPVNESVAGACEMLGLDPLYVANEGVFIAIVDESIAHDVVQFLRQQSDTAAACIVGHVCTEHPKQVILASTIGGRRVVNRLTGEQLPRIC
ncbi:MAG: hydrogenase expression/formation protein HypE [Bacteroidota bacterium]